MTKRPKPRESKKPRKVENLSFLGMEVRMGPVGLHMYAEDFLRAAKATGPTKAPFTPAHRYLVCHALELALKAVLSVEGVSLDTLANRQYGHNLCTLLEATKTCRLSKLVSLTSVEEQEICRAAVYYGETVFTYPALKEAVIAYPNDPDFDILLPLTERLLKALKEPCYCD